MKLSKIILILLLLASPLQAATVWVNSAGSNTSPYDTKAKGATTLQTAMAYASGGDTITIADGTYQGTGNQITTAAHPPVGSAWTAGNYTIVKAETDGGVIFDGQDARNMFWVLNTYPGDTDHWYVQFEGIEWINSSSGVFIQNVSNLKFLRCGFMDGGSGNNSLFRFNRGCTYNLCEGCWFYGSGRYLASCQQTTYIIFRNCVARHDRHDNNGTLNPIGCYASYTCDYTLFQNCIAIDSDQEAYYLDDQYGLSAFYFPTTNGAGSNSSMTNCIALNNVFEGINITGLMTTVSVTNSVFVDLSIRSPYDLNSLRGTGIDIDKCTFINGVSPSSTIFNANEVTGGNTVYITNSIVYGQTGTSSLFNDFDAGVDIEDYNCVNGNTGSGSGAHDITTNPIYNASTNPTGGIKYPVRVESGSNNLDGAGEGGIDIGANCMYLVGTSGTLYGETGYATETATSMWPFPNEALIKTKLAAYNDGGVSGARGFCTGTSLDGSAQTLTKYIWEYLGNQIPADIYGSSPSTPSIRNGGIRNGGLRP